MAEYTGGSVVSYYVDGVDGDNSDNGTSPGTAWKTIQYGFDKIADSTLGDGDELRIMATKVYHIGAPLTSTWSGKEVVITGATSANTALVDGTVVEINGNTADMDGKTMCHSSVATNDHTVFANLYFNAADNAQCCFHDSVTNTHLSRFINCRFSSAKEDGALIDASNYYRWYNCRFDNNAGIGCYQSGSQFAIAYKCLYDNNGGDGLKCSINAVVIDCVSFGNSADGIASSVSGVDVVNCVLDSNFDHGHHLAGSGRAVGIGNIYSNNGSGGAVGSGINVGSNADTALFNCQFYNNDTTWGYTAGVDHLTLYNCVTGGSDPGFLQPYGPTFDFTPSSTFSGIGNGMPTPFTWFGSTADDIGLNKWKSSESISVF